MKEELLKLIKGSKKEKLEQIENMMWNIDMSDFWSKRQEEMYNTLIEIKKEVEKKKKNGRDLETNKKI